MPLPNRDRDPVRSRSSSPPYRTRVPARPPIHHPSARQNEPPIRLAPVDPVESALSDILKQVNDWLKFAEGKNAGIVALASAGAFAVMGAISDRAEDGLAIRSVLAASGVALASSLFLGLASFMPNTDLSRFSRRHKLPQSPDGNLLFYGDLARYAPGDLAEAVAHRYCQSNPVRIELLHIDLAAQIAANSQITLAKLRYFSLAVGLFAVAGVFVTVTIIVSAFA